MPEREHRLLRLAAPLMLLMLAARLAQAAGPEAPQPAAPTQAAATMAGILAASPASAWRPLADDHTLYMELSAGRVIIELAPALAPHTIANIEALARLHYFDGLAVLRLQDNYVAQWGDPDETRKLPDNMQTLAPEFAVPAGRAAIYPAA